MGYGLWAVGYGSGMGCGEWLIGSGAGMWAMGSIDRAVSCEAASTRGTRFVHPSPRPQPIPFISQSPCPQPTAQPVQNNPILNPIIANTSLRSFESSTCISNFVI